MRGLASNNQARERPDLYLAQCIKGAGVHRQQFLSVGSFTEYYEVVGQKLTLGLRHSIGYSDLSHES
jgi:hypothetical protein